MTNFIVAGDAKRNNRMLLCDALNMIKRVPQEDERLTKSVGIKQEPPTKWLLVFTLLNFFFSVKIII